MKHPAHTAARSFPSVVSGKTATRRGPPSSGAMLARPGLMALPSAEPEFARGYLGLRSATPGPLPFSGKNTTPAASSAARMAAVACPGPVASVSDLVTVFR